jgi:adenine-specific DNA-methyltransferase
VPIQDRIPYDPSNHATPTDARVGAVGGGNRARDDPTGTAAGSVTELSDITAIPNMGDLTPGLDHSDEHRMIKYLGSKRRLVPVLSKMAEVAVARGATSALDLFTGTTRVAQAFKAHGLHVTAVDSARYSHAFAQTYIEADAATTDMRALRAAVDHLNSLPGKPGYVHEVFSRQARYFRPENAARIDAARDALESEYAGSPLFPLLLTSLIEAADRVDSTTGLQMAYVKEWAPRSFNPLKLRVPHVSTGAGRAIRGDAVELAPELGHFDLAYLDPPYNQHRYFTNYHVWETLVAWDAPEAYGIARKRVDSRDESTRSPFNSKRTMPAALAAVVRSLSCDLLVVSYNDESWLGVDELEALCSQSRAGTVLPRRTAGSSAGSWQAASGLARHRAMATLAFDSARYVGARIGIFDPSGRKVGRVSHLKNRELLVVVGEEALVRRVVDAIGPTAITAAVRPIALPAQSGRAGAVGRMEADALGGNALVRQIGYNRQSE